MRSTDWVRYNASRFPHSDALEDAASATKLTWRQLDCVVGRTANVLAEQFGIGVGDRVALLAENDIRAFVLQFAAMRLRAALVPLNWRLAIPELRTQLDIADPALLVHDSPWADHAREIVSDSTALLSWESGADDLFGLAAHSEERGPGDVMLDDVVQLLFTSGTTGRPKAAEITAGSLIWHSLNVAQTDDVRGPGDRYLDVLPLFHAGGLDIVAMPILIAGGCVAVVARFEPAACVELMADRSRGFTHFLGVPVMLDQIVATPAFADANLSSFRHIQVGAGRTTPRVIDAFAAKGVPLQAHYGGTEMGPGISGVPKNMVTAKPGSCGLPFRHTRVRITDESGRALPPGEVGEIHVSGPSVALRYVGTGSDAARDDDGWLHTGDLGRLDEDGYLYLVDRLKDMYKSGGENVFPAEVEAVLLHHPGIQEVAVIAVPDPKWGQFGLALYVSAVGHALDTDELQDHCRRDLARYKVPKRFERVDSLPRNATGKVAKAILVAQHAGEPSSAGEQHDYDSPAL